MLWRIIRILIPIVVLLTVLLLVFRVAFSPGSATTQPFRSMQDDIQPVSVNGFDLWYRESGQKNPGPPVVVLHGGPGMSCHYFKDSLEFLATTHRLVYFDQRGSGYSEIKPELYHRIFRTRVNHYTLGALIHDLEVLRRDVVQAEKIILLGHSFGGLVALGYAAEYEQHVDRMVLVSSAAVEDDLWVDFRSGLSILFNNGFPPSDPEAANQWFVNALPSILAESFHDPQAIELLEPGYASFATAMAVRKSTAALDLLPALKGVNVPTLVAYGAAEPASTAEGYQVQIDELLPNSKRVRFERSGHWSFLEERERFASVVGDFIVGNSHE